MMHSFRWLNCSIVWSVHHGIRFPSLSNCRPISSNPCVISCPITAPIPTSKARMALSLRRRIPFTYRHSSNIYNETKIDEDRTDQLIGRADRRWIIERLVVTGPNLNFQLLFAQIPEKRIAAEKQMFLVKLQIANQLVTTENRFLSFGDDRH